jgi:DNA-binding transcriptional LysR family regulator
MNLRQIEVFRAVIATGTTVAAAQSLGMSQSAVSIALKHIETLAGFPLFVRSANRLMPTEEAKLLFAEVEPLSLLHQIVNQKVQDIRLGNVGRVRVVATSELTQSLLPRVVQRFLHSYPDVYLSLETKPLPMAIAAVEDGLADIGFAMEPMESYGVTLHAFAELRTVCLCALNDPLAQLPVVTPRNLEFSRLICPLTGTGIADLLATAFLQSGVPYSPRIEVRFLNAAARIVQEGWGVALLDELTAHSARYDDLAILPFQPNVPRILSWIEPRGRAMSKPTRRFREIFQTVTQDRLRVIRASDVGTAP